MPKRRQQPPNTRVAKRSVTRVGAAIETQDEQESLGEQASSPASRWANLGRRAGLRSQADGWRGIYAFVPGIVALITSINSLWNYFASDDLQQVLGNTFIRRFSNIPASFTTSVWSFTAADVVFTVDSYFRPIF